MDDIPLFVYVFVSILLFSRYELLIMVKDFTVHTLLSFIYCYIIWDSGITIFYFRINNELNVLVLFECHVPRHNKPFISYFDMEYWKRGFPRLVLLNKVRTFGTKSLTSITVVHVVVVVIAYVKNLTLRVSRG